MKDGRAGGRQPSVDERYTQWKTLVPVLYDWLANHNLITSLENGIHTLWERVGGGTCRCKNLRKQVAREGKRQGRILRNEYYNQFKDVSLHLYVWFTYYSVKLPSQPCGWGPQLEQATYKNRQRLYLSEQTDGSVPNTLVIANCEIVKPRVAAAEHISQFNEEARSPFVKKFKTIIHPGEVNRIRELPQDSKIVATHTDSPDVLIWDVESQPNRHALLGVSESHPDLILTGHQDNAEFALAMSPIEPFVLSGGKDKSVVLWSIHDHISSLASNQCASKSPGSGARASNTRSPKVDEVDPKAKSPIVHARGVFQGHEDTVEDVQFCPSSAQEFCSVGDDSCLILWDARTGSAPVIKVEKAHSADLHCVDWNPHDVNLILTGSADNSIRMFDRRSLTSGGVGIPIHTFEGHTAAVLCVQWSPDKSSVFGSSAEDGILNLWDYEKIGKQEHAGTKAQNTPALFFRHAGHRDKVVDFHWNASDPWTIVSVSDDGESTGGGGTLQIWRMIDLIYRPEEEVIAELDKFKSHLTTCSL